ncbi:hypothetical protein AQI94_20670 [Streptomyces pseudovenezuelae]|uniref:Secreted protein n=1 Tax=Streptomyces pseudovenezuelae TaxID=67350 RepID=A0A101N4N4_9ACTN|nr:hypothetical protein AQI94_20670 [Streptomyces pseudovenezuelae]
MHRLLPPSAIAGVALVCAFGPWVFSQQAVLRVIAAFAAAVAVVGAAVMRRWDAQAGKQVADLTRARASDEWRHEERVAELETDLEESRELRVKLEQRLRAKRAELAGLRNEHAALLRRYATAETERASALEGRRLLEIEAAPARALPPAEQADAQTAAEAAENGPETEAEAGTAAEETSGDTETSADGTAAEDGKTSADGKTAEDGKTSEDTEEKPELPAIFSPEGSRLFLRANAALKRLDEDGDGPVRTKAKPDLKADPETDPKTAPKAAPKTQADSKEQPAHAGSAAADTAGTEAEAAQEDEARGKPEAVDGHERAAATTTARAAQPQQQPAGHFIAPTAVAVVPTAPVRRPRVEGGFDFFGTKGEASRDALEAVQNEDLADVVGQEALALHKAESEADFKPADEESRGIGQVIDLTAHDETEQIDLQGLRSAVS